MYAQLLVTTNHKLQHNINDGFCKNLPQPLSTNLKPHAWRLRHVPTRSQSSLGRNLACVEYGVKWSWS